MAAPGICNKLKSYINSLFEYFACGKIFDIEFNKLGKDEDFRNKIENAKNDILNDYYSTASDEDDECSCLSGIFPLPNNKWLKATPGIEGAYPRSHCIKSITFNEKFLYSYS